MAIRRLPPIQNILGIIDNSVQLPDRGAVGDAWYQEGAGLLWIWDEPMIDGSTSVGLRRALPGSRQA